MVLPLFAAFVKGAAEAGEDMIDFKAKTDAEKAALAEKYRLDFQNKKRLANYEATLKKGENTKSAGPYTFQSDLQEGSKAFNLQYLTTLNAGIQSDPALYREFIRQKEQEGTLSQFYTRVGSIFKAYQNEAAQLVKFKSGAEGMTFPTESMFPNLGAALRGGNLNRPQSVPNAARSPNIRVMNGTPVNEQTEQPPEQAAARPSQFIIQATANAPPEVKIGSQKLAELWRKKTSTGLSQQARNRFSNNRMIELLSQPLKSREGVVLGYAADVLDQDSPASLELRRAFGNSISKYISEKPLGEQSAAVSEVTNLFRAFAYTPVERTREVQVPVGEGFSPLARKVLGTEDSYNAELVKRNPAGKGEFEKRASTGRANKKVVDMLGTMQELLVQYRSSGVVGGNFLQAFARKIGGFGQLFAEFIDVSLFDDNDASGLRSALTKARTQLVAADAAIDQGSGLQAGAVFESLNQIVAFALAQIVQTGADKISNADVDNMKAALANSFSSTKMQVATLDTIRRMALKNLMAYDGYMNVVVDSTGLPNFGDFTAAQLQYNTINQTVSSFGSSLAFRNAVDRIEGRTVNTPEGYTMYNTFPRQDEDFTKLSGGESLYNVIEGAWKESVQSYRPEEGQVVPDFVNVRRQISNAFNNNNTQELNQLRDKYLKYSVVTNSERTNTLSSKIYNRLSDDVKRQIVYVKPMHIKNIGFIPFAKVKVGANDFVMKRMVVDGVSLFANEEDAIRAFEGGVAPELRATGGPVPISDRLKTLQKSAAEE